MLSVLAETLSGWEVFIQLRVPPCADIGLRAAPIQFPFWSHDAHMDKQTPIRHYLAKVKECLVRP